MTLEDLILCDRPPNMDVLLCEMRARKTLGRFANGIVGGLLRQFTALVDARAPDEITSANNAVEAISAASGGVRRHGPRRKPGDFTEFRVRKISVGNNIYELPGVFGVRLY